MFTVRTVCVIHPPGGIAPPVLLLPLFVCISQNGDVSTPQQKHLETPPQTISCLIHQWHNQEKEECHAHKTDCHPDLITTTHLKLSYFNTLNYMYHLVLYRPPHAFVAFT